MLPYVRKKLPVAGPGDDKIYSKADICKGKPRLTEFEYMIGKSEKTFESVIITLLLCIFNQKQSEYL